MPKLYVFVTCEKVIVGQDGKASLIDLFNELTTFISEDRLTSVPANAVTPKEWAVFTSWEREPQDDGKKYIQEIQVLNPDGTPFGETLSVPFTMPLEKTHHQIVSTFQGFPIGVQGMHSVRMLVKKDGDTVFGPSLIRISVKHSPPPAHPA
jgi:hypothetical protein